MTEEQVRRQRWFQHLKSFASRQGELHPYGSEAWCHLPDRSWRKIAAACLLGEAWQQETENLPTRVFDEWWLTRAEEDAYWAGVDERARRVVRAHGRVLPYAERGIPRRVS